MCRKQINIYIAGPMAGKEKFNHPAFDAAEQSLKSKGIYKPYNPALADREGGLSTAELQERIEDKAIVKRVLKRDVDAIFECSSIYMLRGWEHSKGARMEHALAVALGYSVQYQ